MQFYAISCNFMLFYETAFKILRFLCQKNTKQKQKNETVFNVQLLRRKKVTCSQSHIHWLTEARMATEGRQKRKEISKKKSDKLRQRQKLINTDRKRD